MNRFLRGVARATIESFALPDPVLEIGSYQVEGREDVIDLRGLFPGRPYTGVDFRAGPRVDLVAAGCGTGSAACSPGAARSPRTSTARSGRPRCARPRDTSRGRADGDERTAGRGAGDPGRRRRAARLCEVAEGHRRQGPRRVHQGA